MSSSCSNYIGTKGQPQSTYLLTPLCIAVLYETIMQLSALIIRSKGIAKLQLWSGVQVQPKIKISGMTLFLGCCFLYGKIGDVKITRQCSRVGNVVKVGPRGCQ